MQSNEVKLHMSGYGVNQDLTGDSSLDTMGNQEIIPSG
jgi:hypothetical protein